MQEWWMMEVVKLAIWLEIIVITIILIISALFHPHHHHTISIFCHLSLHTRWHRLVSLSRRPSRRRWQMPEIQKSQHFRLGNLSTVVEKKYLFDLMIKVLCRTKICNFFSEPHLGSNFKILNCMNWTRPSEGQKWPFWAEMGVDFSKKKFYLTCPDMHLNAVFGSNKRW